MRSIISALTLLMSFQFQAQIAPDFTVTDIDGNDHTLYEYLDDGKVVILDFFAVWCVPCQDNAPDIEEIWETLGPDGTNEVMILGLEGDNGSTDDQVAQYAVDYNCTNPQINDTGDLMDVYGIDFYPTYLVVCPDRSYSMFIGGELGQIGDDLIDAVDNCAPLLDLAIDARIFSYNSSTTVCSDETTPNITLMNMGQSNLTSVEIELYLDGELLVVLPWTGDLAQFEFENVSLQSINLGGSTDPEILVTLVNPNNTDDPNPDNDSVTVPIEYGGETFEVEYVRFELYFDNFPQETSWDFKTSQGEIIFSGSDYIGFPDFSPPIDTILPFPEDDCYLFTIYDSYGDGICCNFADDGEGFWKISDENDVILAEGGTFEYEESALFGLVLPIDVDEVEMATPSIYPNPVKDIVSIEVSDGWLNSSFDIYGLTGKLVRTGRISDFMTTLDLSNLAKGLYVVRILNGDRVLSNRLVVE